MSETKRAVMASPGIDHDAGLRLAPKPLSLRDQAILTANAKPAPVTDIAFPSDALKIMPKMLDIPEEFKNGNGQWNRLFGDWFYSGIDGSGLIPADGISKADAFRHLKVIAGSFAPKHEHKEAAFAYLASLWFKPESTWEKLK